MTSKVLYLILFLLGKQMVTAEFPWYSKVCRGVLDRQAEKSWH